MFCQCRECRKLYYEKRKEHFQAYTKNWYKENKQEFKANFMLSAAKQRSKLLDLDFNITIEDVCIPDTCPLLGIKLRTDNKKSLADSPSLDRIDPSKGYVKGNVWVISYKANTVKNNASLEELKLLVKNLHKRMNTK